MTALTAVRTALKLCDSEHATFLTSLIDKDMVKSFRSIKTSNTKRLFGKSEADLPQLGKELSTFDANKLPTAQELQEICMRGLTDTRECFVNWTFSFGESGTAEHAANSDDEDAVMNIVKTIYDFEADYETPGRAISFISDTLDDMSNAKFEEPDDCIEGTSTIATVLPGHTLLPLQHSNEGTITTTVLSGSIIWIIWPPTEHNLEILRTAYENFAQDFDEAKLKVIEDLDGGIIFEQTEGEGLRIPPFCLTLAFSTTTCVLATYSTVTVDNYISMLRKMPLLKAWFKTELDGQQKKTEFKRAMLAWLDRLLNGDIDDETGELDDTYKLTYTNNGTLDTLLRAWDEVKDDIAEMIGSVDAVVIEEIWSDFLIHSRGRECKVCGKTIKNKKKDMRKHFVDQHWQYQKVRERLDSMEAMQDDSDETASEPEKAMKGGDEEQFDDKMDVDY